MERMIVPKVIECSRLINDKENVLDKLSPINKLCLGDYICDEFFRTDTDIGKYIGSIRDDEKKKNKIWEILIKNAYLSSGEVFSKSEVYLLTRKNAVILKSSDYKDNEYYRDIKLDEDIRVGRYILTKNKYLVGEMMAYDIGEIIENNVSVPKLGIWQDEFEYITLGESGNAWMTITPNEINTMKEPIENACGKVLTFGLGLGYFGYLASLKENVESVTIVEKSDVVIDIFIRYILPQFKTKDKINIVKADMFEYVKDVYIEKEFDYVFVDIWQDCTEVYTYLKARKALKNVKNVIVDYWISEAIEQILLDDILFDYSELLIGNMEGSYSSIDEPILTKRVVQRALKDTEVYKLDIKNEVLNINYMLPKILEAMDEHL